MHKRASIYYCICMLEKAEVLNKEAIYLSYVPLLQMINWSTFSAYVFHSPFSLCRHCSSDAVIYIFFAKFWNVCVAVDMEKKGHWTTCRHRNLLSKYGNFLIFISALSSISRNCFNSHRNIGLLCFKTAQLIKCGLEIFGTINAFR